MQLLASSPQNLPEPPGVGGWSASSAMMIGCEYILIIVKNQVITTGVEQRVAGTIGGGKAVRTS
jgi:hypothetical protein